MAGSDWALLERWKRDRDAEAFAELATRYAGVVYGTCRRVLGDAVEAEDAAQECFLTLAQTRKPPRTNLGAWLHRVAMNKARDLMKAARRRRDREGRYMDGLPTETETPWREIESLVDDAIAKLPEATRDAIVAHFMLGESHAAIAERLGVSRQTVTYRVGRGVEGIRAALRTKGIPVGASALTASLTANMAEAAPAQLVAALGKIAVTGVPAAAGGAAALAGALTAKNLLVGIGLCTVFALSWFLLNPEADAPAPAVSSVREQLTPEGPTRVANSAHAQTEPALPRPESKSAPTALPETASDDWSTLKCTVLDVEGNVVTPVPGADGQMVFPVEIRGVVDRPYGRSTGSFSSVNRWSDDGVFVIDSWKPGDRGAVYAYDDKRNLVSDCVDFALTLEGPSRITLQLMPGARVSGTFVDADGLPVPDTSIRAEHANDVFTNVRENSEDGHFDLGPLPPGEYTLIPVPSDATLMREFKSAATTLNVVQAQHATGVVLVYEGRRAVVAGHVLEVTGRPVSDTSVRISNDDISGAQLGERWWLNTRTDGEGRFEFPVYAPNRFKVSAPELRQIEKVFVEAGTQDIEVVVEPVYRIIGNVLRSDTGEPVEEFRVIIHTDYGFRSIEESNCKDGRFEIVHSGPANVTLEVSSPGLGSARNAFALSKDTTEFTVRLQPQEGLSCQQEISGRVVDAKGQGIPGARIFVEPPDPPMAPLATTEDDGGFTLASLSPDVVDAYILHRAYRPTKVPVIRDNSWVITMPEGGEVEGTVFVGGVATAGLRVQAPVKLWGAEITRDTDTDMSGHYRLIGLPAGVAEVSVRVDGRDAKQTINVVEGSRARLDYRIPAADAHLAGHVYVGSLPVRAGVNLSTPNHHPAGRAAYYAETGPDGAYRFDKLLSGPVRLMAFLYGQVPRMKQMEFQLAPGGMDGVNIEFAPGDAVLEGIVASDLASTRPAVGLTIRFDTPAGSETLALKELPLSDGAYRLEGLPEGLAIVTFSPLSNTGGYRELTFEILLESGRVARQDVLLDNEAVE